MASDDEVLKVEEDGAVRIVTLNRPDALNSFSDELHEEVADVWNKLGQDPGARAVVLTGAGRAFSAGGDVPGFASMVHQHERRRGNLRTAQRLVDEMLRFHLPVVAAVNGPAVGLGASLAVMCDIVFMSEKSFMADPHVAVGLVAGDGGAVMWPFMMSMLQAKRYLLTGDRIYPPDALRLGLANEVVPPEDLMTQALAMAHRLAELPSQAMQDTKRALNIHMRVAANAVLPFALSAEEISFTTEDVQNASKKFSAKS